LGGANDSTPSTVILDGQGRVAAIALGEVTSTLVVQLVHDSDN
jgi:uncharacterized protein YjdB